MNAPAQPPPAPRDARAVLAAVRAAIEGRFVGLQGTPAAAWPRAVRTLLLALELRWKLEQQLLFPALFDAHGQDRSGFDADEAELQPLRDLAERAQSSAGLVQQRALLVGLESIAAEHFQAIDRLLRRSADDKGVDWLALGDQMNAMLERWHREVDRSGDIEDEDRDPVGLPPR